MLLWSNLLKLRHFATMLLTFALRNFCVCVLVFLRAPPLCFTLCFLLSLLFGFGSWSLLNFNQKCEIWSALHLTLWEKLPQTLMKKIGSLSSWTFCSCCCCIEDPECTWYHFRCKFHGSNPLSSPTSNSPAVDRRTDKEKTSARMDINQTEMENRREGWEKKHCKFGQTLTGWANSDFTSDSFTCFS